MTNGAADRVGMDGRQCGQHGREVKGQVTNGAANRVGEHSHGWLTVWPTQ